MSISIRTLYSDRGRILRTSLILFQILSAILIYSLYFDILIESGSYKSNLGPWFFLLIIILVLIQIFVTGSIVHLAMRAINNNHKATKHDAFLISGLNTLMYSLTYAIFPTTGPFYYITFTMETNDPIILLIEIMWTTFTILLTGTALKRTYSIPWRYGLLMGGISSMLILAFAS